MPTPAYQRLADDLRRSIENGDYPPGQPLPKRIEDYAAEYGISKQTAREAISLLEAEGLVEAVRRRGTVVRERPARRRLTRSREVYRDDRGYFFDSAAQPWRALQPPSIGWGRPPRDVADLMGVNPTDEVLIRDRVMGDPDTGAPTQLATSYLPAGVARGTVLATADTGPGGIYDRLEEMGHRPLQWSEAVSARMPTPAEAAALHLPPGVPLLRILRVTRAPGGLALEINDTRMSADAFEVGYPITRHGTARAD